MDSVLANAIVKIQAVGIQQTGREIDSLGSKLQRFGQMSTLYVTAPLLGIAGAAIKVAASFEQSQIAFTNLLGSAGAAKSKLQELQNFAKVTPFQFSDLVKSTQKMLAYGFAAQSVVPMLRDIGDANAGLAGGAEGLERVVRALGQMKAKGIVSAEEMNQLTEAGIKGWQYLAKTLNVDVATAMKMVTARSVDAETAISSLLAGMRRDFGGSMAKMAETTAGKFSNLKDEMEQLGIKLGTTLLPTINKILERVLKLVEAFESMPDWAKNSIGAGAIGAGIVGPLAVGAGTTVNAAKSIKDWISPAADVAGAGAIGAAGLRIANISAWPGQVVQTTTKVGLLTRAVGLLTNPITIAIAAIAALALGINFLHKKASEARNAEVSAAENKVKTAQKNINDANEKQSKLNLAESLVANYSTADASGKKNILKSLKDLGFSNINTAGKEINDARYSIDANNATREKTIKAAQLDVEKKKLVKLEEDLRRPAPGRLDMRWIDKFFPGIAARKERDFQNNPEVKAKLDAQKKIIAELVAEQTKAVTTEVAGIKQITKETDAEREAKEKLIQALREEKALVFENEKMVSKIKAEKLRLGGNEFGALTEEAMGTKNSYYGDAAMLESTPGATTAQKFRAKLLRMYGDSEYNRLIKQRDLSKSNNMFEEAQATSSFNIIGKNQAFIRYKEVELALEKELFELGKRRANGESVDAQERLAKAKAYNDVQEITKDHLNNRLSFMEKLSISSTRLYKGDTAAQLKELEYQKKAKEKEARELFKGNPQELALALAGIGSENTLAKKDIFGSSVRWKGIEDINKDAQLNFSRVFSPAPDMGSAPGVTKGDDGIMKKLDDLIKRYDIGNEKIDRAYAAALQGI